MENWYTIGFDKEYNDLPDRYIDAETAYGAIRQYLEMFPSAIWISANNLLGTRQQWETNRNITELPEADFGTFLATLETPPEPTSELIELFNDDFNSAAEYILNKNAELYKRLA